jgi:hypothetical protein
MMSAVLGLPVTRGATNSVACYQVYCEHKRRRVEQFPEAPPPPRPEPPAYATATPPESIASPLLDHSLFQRPPPSPGFARL